MSKVSSLPLNKRLLALLGFALSGIIAFYFYYLRPKEVEGEAARQTPTHIQNQIQGQIQPQLNQIVERLGRVEGSTEKLPAIEQRLTDIYNRSAELDKRIDRLFESFTRNTNTLKAALDKTINVERRRLIKTLPVAAELLEYAKHKGTPLGARYYQKVALPFVERDFRDSVLDKEAWNLVGKFASHKTFIDGDRFGVPRAVQAENKHFDATVFIDGLSSSNNVFVNCHVIYQNGGLHLENVRFVDCTFDVVDDFKGKEFFKSLLISDSRAIKKIEVEGPLFRTGALIK